MRHATRALAVAAVPGLLIVLSACGNSSPSSDPEPTATATVTVTPNPTLPTAPTATPTPTPAPAPAPAPAPSSAAALAALLLPAAQVPGFNEQWTWTEQATTTMSEPAGVCARLPLDALGADAVVRRTYVPTGDQGEGTAVHEVASFVDQTSVKQAVAVIRSWHDDCRQRLKPTLARVRVAPISTVATPKGQASWYLTTTVAAPADDSGHFDAVGVVVSGTTIAVLDLDLVGQDYNYVSGSEPMVAALRNAAALLP